MCASARPTGMGGVVIVLLILTQLGGVSLLMAAFCVSYGHLLATTRRIERRSPAQQHLATHYWRYGSICTGITATLCMATTGIGDAWFTGSGREPWMLTTVGTVLSILLSAACAACVWQEKQSKR